MFPRRKILKRTFTGLSFLSYANFLVKPLLQEVVSTNHFIDGVQSLTRSSRDGSSLCYVRCVHLNLLDHRSNYFQKNFPFILKFYIT